MNFSRRVLFLLLGSCLTASAWGQATAPPTTQPAKPKDPAYDKITDDPKLPRVLLIGDSISIGYTVPVRKALAGVANIHRINTNGGPTSNGVKQVDAWVREGKWDVIHFNFGLHDLKIMDDKRQVPLDEYEANLRKIVERLQQTGAKLIWCSTTPVPEGKLNPPRDPADVAKYNAVAKKIMDEKHIPIDELNAFATSRLKEIQQPVNVHFTAKGSEALGEEVAKSIKAALSGK